MTRDAGEATPGALPDPLRVLHVTTSTDAGGAETMLRRTLRVMRDRGGAPRVEARVACIKPLGAIAPVLKSDGFAVDSLEAPGPGRGLSGLSWAVREAGVLLKLRRLIRQHRPHVVQTWLPRADLLARMAAVGTGATVCCSVHVVDLTRDWPARLDGLTHRLAAGRLAVSVGVAEHHSRVSGIPRDAYDVIPNALEDWEFEVPDAAATFRSRHGIPPDAVLVAAVARLHPQKGIPDLIDAVAQIPREGRPLMVAIAGDGPQRDELEALVQRHGLGGIVKFLGRLADPRELLAAADVFVLPSLYEGMPVALIEAIALGRACIATTIPGTDEVVTHGQDALLVPPRDPEALARAISGLRDDDALRARLGAAALRRARDQFGMRRNADLMLGMWSRALVGRRRGGDLTA